MLKPQFESVSNFRNHSNEILQKLAGGPLYLLQYSSPAAILVDPKQWDAILDRLALLEELEEQVAVYRHKWLTAIGKAPQDVMSPEALEAWAAADEKGLA